MNKKVIFLGIVLTACGPSPKEETPEVPKVETFLWSSGQRIPNWFIRDGTYQSLCIAMPTLFAGARTIHQQLEYTVKHDWIGVKIVVYESGGCSAVEYFRAQEAPVDMAYVGVDAKTNQKYIVYSANKQGKTTRQEYYLSRTEADLLNKYNICGKVWQGDALNSVLDVSEAICKADVEKIDTGSLDKSMSGLIVMRAFLWTFDPFLDMSIRDGESGIWVKSGPGLYLDSQEHFFKSAPDQSL